MKKKIRVGMIGYGFMGKAHTNAFRQAAKFFPDLPYEPELKNLIPFKKVTFWSNPSSLNDPEFKISKALS